MTNILPDKYKTQRLCDEAVDDSLAPLKIIPDRFVASTTIRKLYPVLFAADSLVFF